MPIICGPDNWDARMAPVPLGDPAKVDLKSLRVACYKSNSSVQEPTAEIQSLVSTCVGYFSKLGCKVKEDRPPKMLELSEIRQKYEGADGRERIRCPAEEARRHSSPLRACGWMATS